MSNGAAATKAIISKGATSLALAMSPRQVEALDHLLGELRHWNRRVNLTAIRDPDDMVPGHILDSLSIEPYLTGAAILDVGTGPGFPGLPLAIANPRRQFTLIDSNRKKLGFVRHMVGELELGNVDVVHARAEDYAPGQRFDTVIARALATVPRLVELTSHLVGEDGRLLAMKGRYPAAELDAAKSLPGWEYSVVELVVPGLEAHDRHLVIARRDGS